MKEIYINYNNSSRIKYMIIPILQAKEIIMKNQEQECPAIKDLFKINDVGICPECNGNTFTVDDYGINMNMLITIEGSKVKVKLDNFNHDYLVCTKCDTPICFHPEDIKEIEVDFKF